MPWQLIYTSAPRGLVPGQSGFCTVARSAGLREGLIPRLEGFSAYHHLAQPGEGASCNPVIAAYRVLDLRGDKYHVLSRIVDAGLDFTRRTNHLAHHLIFTPEELATLPNPAALLAGWDGWLNQWSGEPRLVDDEALGNLDDVPRLTPLPARAWAQLTGDAGRAAALLEARQHDGFYLICAPGQESVLLNLFAESLQLLNPAGKSPSRMWQIPFTNFLQGEDNPAEFRWRGGWMDTPGYEAVSRTETLVIAPQQLPVPGDELAELARRGLPETAPAPRTALVMPVVPVAAPAAVAPAPPEKVHTPARLKREEPNEPWQQPSPADPVEAGAGRAPAVPHAQDRKTAALLRGRKAMPAIIAAIVLAALAGVALWFRQTGNFRPPVGTLPAATNRPAATSPGGTAPFAKPAPARTAPPLGPTQAALDQLPNQWDDLPTYLFIVREGSAVELSGVPGLTNLAAALHDVDNPILAPEIQLHLRAATQISFSERGQRRALQMDSDRRLSTEDRAVLFDLKPWFLTRGSPQAAPIPLQLGGFKSECVSLVLAPPERHRAFEPFRLLLLHAGAEYGPLQLRHWFLVPEQDTLLASLHPLLGERFGRLILPPRARASLTPFVVEPGGPAVSLFEGAPGETEGLRFEALRSRTEKQLGAVQEELKKLQGDHARVEKELNELLRLDFELGKALGAAPRYHSLAAYGRGTVRKVNQALFLEYLDQVFTAIRQPEAAAALQQLRQGKEKEREAALRQLEKIASNAAGKVKLKTGSFTRRWDELKADDEPDKRVNTRRQLDLQLAELALKLTPRQEQAERLIRRLTLIPADLQSTPQVRLLVTLPDTPGRPIELVRFTPPEPTRSAP